MAHLPDDGTKLDVHPPIITAEVQGPSEYEMLLFEGKMLGYLLRDPSHLGVCTSVGPKRKKRKMKMHSRPMEHHYLLRKNELRSPLKKW